MKKKITQKKPHAKKDISKSLLMTKLLEPKLNMQLTEMGNSTAAIYDYQKKRVIMSSLMGFVGVIGFVKGIPVIGLGGLGMAGFLWYQRAKRVSSLYQFFQFKKQLNFSKFMRLMIPYLLQGSDSLYSILNRMYLRIEDPYIKKRLEILMVEMNEFPGVLTPFESFAKQCSGSETALLFMTTLFDFQQTSFDTSVIAELGAIASEELFNSIDDIAALKLKRFGMFPTKMTMGSFLITIGFIGGLVIDLVSKIKL